MNSLIPPNNHDVFNTIWHNHLFPQDLTKTNSPWNCSRDIQNLEILRNLERIEAFVEKVVQSNETAFVFDKSGYFLALKKQNPLGHRFYDLLTAAQPETALRLGNVTRDLKFSRLLSACADQELKTLPDWCRYENSNYSKIFFEIAQQLHLGKATFSGDPSRNILPGLCEGELANSFITRIREASHRPAFKAALDTRVNTADQAFNQAKTYLLELQNQIPGLYAVPLIVCYPQTEQNPVTLEASNCQLHQFLDLCQADPSLQSPVGWWWKRECISEIGYRYTFYFFFDGNTSQYTALQLLNTYRCHWQRVTYYQGGLFIPPGITEMPSGEMRINDQPNLQENLDTVLFKIACDCQRDRFLKLKKGDGVWHYGMNKELPVTDDVFTSATDQKPHNALPESSLTKWYSKISPSSVFITQRNSADLKLDAFKTKKLIVALELLENFVDEVILIKEQPFVSCLSYNGQKVYHANDTAVFYYPRLLHFIQLLPHLSDRYEYSEAINCFRRCCQTLELEAILNALQNHKFVMPAPEYKHPLKGYSIAELFNEFVLRIRQYWKSNHCQSRVNERHKDAVDRYQDYCDYADGLFQKRAKLIVIRLDLSYSKQFASSKSVFDMTRDLDHLLQNKRHNPNFKFLKGYIAKIEFGIEKHIHCHLLLFFDGSKKKNNPVYFAQEIGEYWKTFITQGQGAYWNVNHNEACYKKLDRLGIGVILRKETMLREHLKEYVIHYLCKPDQLIRPMYSGKVKLFRRGNFPKIKAVKPGRPRQDDTHKQIKIKNRYRALSTLRLKVIQTKAIKTAKGYSC